MRNFTADSKVLIVGGGPGGLALAQTLRANNINFEIFEREDGPTRRHQGWSFGLIEALSILPPMMLQDMGDIQQTSVNHMTGAPDSMAIVDAKTADVKAVLGGRPAGQPGHIVRGVRQRLRDYLSQHLDIHNGKEFSRYEETQDSVTVFFKDGTSAQGDILVAADGTHSRIRAQMLQDDETNMNKIDLSEWIPIFAECELPQPLFESVYNKSTAGMLAATDTLRVQMGPRNFKEDRSSAEYYFAVAFLSQNPAADSAWVQNASKEALHQRVLDLTRGFSPLITQVIESAGADGMVAPQPKFVEFVPPKALPRGRVTLLGDAAHTMLPFKGAGANTAIRDACDLAKLLISSTKDAELSIDWLLQQYEGIMLSRGREMVLASRASGRNAAGVMAALEGRIDTYQKDATHHEAISAQT